MNNLVPHIFLVLANVSYDYEGTSTYTVAAYTSEPHAQEHCKLLEDWYNANHYAKSGKAWEAAQDLENPYHPGWRMKNYADHADFEVEAIPLSRHLPPEMIEAAMSEMEI